MTDSLLPCPFCGGKAISTSTDWGYGELENELLELRIEALESVLNQ